MLLDEEDEMFGLKESIRPSADLRNHYSEISRQCRENKEAVIITVNGRGDLVSLSYEEYKRMKARIELLEILAEADEDEAPIGSVGATSRSPGRAQRGASQDS